jgi:hypothetical protein
MTLGERRHMRRGEERRHHDMASGRRASEVSSYWHEGRTIAPDL